ncbi:family 20 glycosylhydrolase [Tamlana sp. 2201CG12-4]|uniref:beta-N-acetylhexosaminidase n=1 Tax=Tamlana sp. 2201CG12-4 TaxID=3112582 RepID=UPI002DBB312D|nr:family 20 glycosylhydrolase [Tamlana sp. 2201CG12-4]MEC3907216.1 family 20 glycosylhydrolase [Tamlana sp. 2201CG12-4]
MISKKLLISTLFGVIFFSTFGAFANSIDKIFPVPQKVVEGKGTFILERGRILLGPDVKLNLFNNVSELRDLAIEKSGASLSIVSALAEHEAAQISIIIDSKVSLRSQGYKLNISETGVQIVANNEAGAFYAIQTLIQVIRFSEKGKLPYVTIEDWPDFERRGIMVDVSRNKVPTMETLKRTIDRFAEWKINEVQLYIEHTFAYKNHKTVWEEFSPITAEQILELDKYCAERFIDLVPNQNSFGHMKRWLQHDEYVYLSERPGDASSDDWIINNNRSTLCATDNASVEFMNELLGEYLPNFSSKYANIGGDEPYELGTGKSAQACKEKGKPVVYLEYMKKMNNLVNQFGKKTQMWGDIVNKHPELIPMMPKDITCMIWGYRPEHPYNKQCPRFKKEGIPFYVCPGTNGWRSFIGKTDRGLANIINATTNGKKYGAYGVLMTDWGDLGHMQPFTVAFPPYIYGAAMSWSTEKNKDVNIEDILNTHVFLDESEALGKALMTLTNAYKAGGDQELLTPYFNMINRTLEPFEENYITRNYNMSNLQGVCKEIEKAMNILESAKPRSYDGEVAIKEMRTAAKLADFMCRVMIDRSRVKYSDIFNISFSKRKEYAKELEQIIKDFSKTWILRNRIGGLSDTNKFFEDIVKILNTKDTENCSVVPRLRL